MRWSSLTLLYLHLISPGGNKSVLSGFTIPNRDMSKGLWWSTRRQNVAVGYGSSISQVSISPALQCCGSLGHVFTLLPLRTSN